MVEDLVDARRVEPAFIGGERQMLEAWLDFHRLTLLLKCEGLDDASRRARPVESSLLSLHGLVRHMADVERNWFTRVLLSRPDTPHCFGSHVDDSEFDLAGADWDADVATWEAEIERSRVNAAAHGLDDTGTRRGEQVSLRWIYVHMIEEYARHNGHADLIREMLDGAVGW